MRKLTIEEMRKIAKERGGECLSKEYFNANTKLTWKCSEGHIWEATPDRIKRGSWCPICAGNMPPTIEDMIEIAKERGGECLSDQYINTHTKLRWKCDKGHIWENSPSNIKRGQWCPYCSGRYNLSLEKMKDIAKERGGECLSNQYINSDTKLKWRCSEGHIWEATPSNILNRKSWCPFCSGTMKLNIEQMKDIARERGGECLSDQYINTHTKLSWRCSEGHEWDAESSCIRSGSWCPICSGNTQLTLEEMKDIAKERGGECLSDQYINTHTKLSWRCSEGHEWDAESSCIRSGSWCPICSGNTQLTLEDMKNIAKERGGECLSKEYINSHTKLSWRCSEGHEWDAEPSKIKFGQWCPYCGIGIGEEISRKMFEILFDDNFPRIRPKWLINPHTGKRLELDGYCKNINLAFEYQGEQHYIDNIHFYKGRGSLEKRKQYDRIKRQLCLEKGIILIEIPYYIDFKDLPNYIFGECKKNNIEINKIPIDIFNYESFNDVYISNNIEKMRAIARDRGGRCLSENYVNAKTRLLWECSQGHQWEAVPDSIIHGTWCPYCDGKYKTIKDMQDIAKEREGVCLSEKYVNNRTKILWRCKEGHEWKATPDNIKQGTWCPICARMKRKRKMPNTLKKTN